MLRILSLVTVLLAASSARANDYDTSGEQWNSLRTFAQVIKSHGYEVVERSVIDWREVSEKDVLCLVSPQTSLDSKELRMFVENGGRLIVADDFGSADNIFFEFGWERSQAGRASRVFGSHAFAPVALPLTKDHALTEGISAVVTNHPAVFSTMRSGLALWAIDGQIDQTIVAIETMSGPVTPDGRLKLGQLIGIADPSILIGRMLEIPDNLRFAIALVRSFDRNRTERFIIAHGEIKLIGPAPEPDPRTLPPAKRANDWLAEANEYILTKPGIRVLAVAIPLFGFLMGFLWLKSRRKVPESGEWTRLAAGGHGSTDLFAQALSLRAMAERRIAVLLEIGDPLSRLNHDLVLVRAEQRLSPRAKAAFDELYPMLLRVSSVLVRNEPITWSEVEKLGDTTSRFYSTLIS